MGRWGGGGGREGGGGWAGVGADFSCITLQVAYSPVDSPVLCTCL